MAGTGVYPGSFNPPTVAHLAIAEAFRDAHDLERVDLSVSRVALAKEDVERPLLAHRFDVLTAVAASRPWLGAVLTDAQLLVDVAEGYDSLVMGADKWHQILDPVFYGDSTEARDDAVARLPRLAIVPRPPLDVPREHRLDVAEHLADVSSSAVRAGERDWMLPEAAVFDERTGAWSDLDRYERFLATDQH